MKLILLLFAISCLNSCQTPSHQSSQYYANIVIKEALINGKPVLVIDEQFSICSHRSYFYGINEIGPSSEWTNVSIHNCLKMIGSGYNQYIDDNTFFNDVRLELKSQMGQGD